MERVSSYNLHQVALNSALNVQAQLANAQTQEATGLVSTDYGNLGGQKSYELLNMEKELNQAQSWSSQATTVGDRTQAMYSAVGSMNSVLTKLQTSLSSSLSSTDNSNLTTTVQGYLDSLVSAMNTQEGGRYLFSGSDTSTAPVDMSSYDSTSVDASSYDSTAQDFSYYKGDNANLSVQVDSSTTITYGVRAGVTSGTTPTTTDSANTFELAIRACECALKAASTSPVSTTLLQSAYDLSSSALTKMSNLQESISAVSNQLSTATSTQTNYVTLLQSSISNIKDVDTATVTTQISQYQTQLQASYYAVSTIQKVNLTSYL
ncbi:MAG TPA: flagellin [Candidatus Sulfotelmatobacter sp.]|jgi:flagellar hook-associated protein 3 FlgL|nr:flagellin [Candidatus Sulfotelmatobacter sp.]